MDKKIVEELNRLYFAAILSKSCDPDMKQFYSGVIFAVNKIKQVGFRVSDTLLGGQ
jgi:hypothetical protein